MGEIQENSQVGIYSSTLQRQHPCMEGLHLSTQKASSGLHPHDWRRVRPCLKSEGPKIIPSLQGPPPNYGETWGVSGQKQRCGKSLSALLYMEVIYLYSEGTIVCYLLCSQGSLESLWLAGLSQLRSQPPSLKSCLIQSQMSPDAGQEKKFWEVDPCGFLSHYCTHL